MANYIRQMTKDVTVHNQLKSYKGYTLFSPVYDNVAWLIDMDGRICHYWQMETKPGIQLALLENGNLMWQGKGPNVNEYVAASADHLIEVDWEGKEVWRYDDTALHHDFHCLENGNIMILRFVDIPERISREIKGGIPGTELQGKILGIQVREINRKGETLWEWNNYEHFDLDAHVIHPYDNRQIWGYTNSVDVFDNGDVLLSVREFDKVIRIDRNTGNIVWQWGPEQYMGHPHDASVTKEGNVTIFDNGIHRRSIVPEGSNVYELGEEKVLEFTDMPHFTVSRALEVDPRNDEIVWEYIDPMHIMYTQFCGSTQKLSNGNYLISEGVKGVFWEVSQDHEVVWKYISPLVYRKPSVFGWTMTKQIFQAHRYGTDYPGLVGKDLDPEKYEWTIRKKSRVEMSEEEKVRQRLAKAGY